MERKVYLTDGLLALSEYVREEDDIDLFECWQDEETQRGFNYKFNKSFAEFCESPIQTRFIATIIRLSDNAQIGTTFVSPENTLPDVAIMLFRPYRNMGYGSRAFALATKYCFNYLKLGRVYAGCYPENDASRRMLKRCGFVPHPEGNQKSKHYLTGESIIQFDFIAYSEANLQ